MNPQVNMKYGNSRLPIPITLPARFTPVIRIPSLDITTDAVEKFVCTDP